MGQQIINRSQTPTKGLYTSSVADALGPEYSPWCQNIRFRFGEILRAPGRSVVLQTMPKMLLDHALHTDIVGNQTVFGLEADTLIDNQAAPYNATTHQFGTALPLGVNSQTNRRFSWTQGEERTFVVRSSNIAAIRATSPGVFAVEQLTSPQGLFLEYFSNRVFLMNLVGVAANRIQWSARANYTDWGQGEASGGWLDLYEGVVEPISNGKILNDRLVVYRNSSITDIVSTGDDTSPFLPQGRVYGLGCIAPFTLASAGQFHLFLGNDYNVYVWDGAKLTPVGTPIHNYIRQIFDPGAPPDWRYSAFAAMHMGFKEYHLVIPQWQTTQCIVLIYDYLRDTWTRDSFTSLRSLYEFPQTGPVGTAGYDATGYPTLFPVLMASRDKDYFMIDERVVGDRLSRPADGGMEMFVDTPDMYYDPKAMTNATLERLMVAQGWPKASIDPTYLVEVSIDRGQTFPVAMSVAPKLEHWGFEFVDPIVTSNVRRYRFRYPVTSGAAKPSWRAYSDLYVPSGEFFPTERTVGVTRAEPGPELPPTGVE